MIFTDPVTLPLNIEQLKLLIEGNQASTPTNKKSLDIPVGVLVDYGNSSIKGINFLNYISNLQLSASIVNCPKEDRIDLLKMWMQFKGLCKIKELRDAAMKCFGFPVEDDFLSKEECALVPEDILSGWNTFFASIQWSIPFFNNKYRESVGKELLALRTIKAVEDPYLTGKTIAHVLQVEGFVEHAVSQCPRDIPPLYLQYAMETQYFGGNTLVDILSEINQGHGSSLINFLLVYMDNAMATTLLEGTLSGKDSPNTVPGG